MALVYAEKISSETEDVPEGNIGWMKQFFLSMQTQRLLPADWLLWGIETITGNETEKEKQISKFDLWANKNREAP